uniref:F5/8 type C domain-containing protein n=1 Tax=Pseudomonas phage HRDY3 TaxID=3236930 RepID=A0AB39CDV5_9VIRU
MAKLTGATAQAATAHNDFGPSAASAIDGNTGTGWASGNTYGNTTSEMFALVFPTPVTVKMIKVMFYSWSRNIKIGYADTYSNSHAAYTVIQDIDATAGAVDDLGVAWAYQNTNASMDLANTITIPGQDVAARVWAVFTDDATSGPLSRTGGTVDRLRILEIEMYDDGAGSIAINPKPPATVPVLPFTAATPVGWTKTEFSAPGIHNFTPAADTTMLLVVGQGAGAAGRVYAALDGSPTPSSGISGGDTFVTTAKGEILRAPGGKTNVLADVISGIGKHEDNWLRYVDSNARAGSIALSSAAPAGGQSYLQGTQGAAFTLATQQTNAPADTASNAFTGPSPTTKLTWEFTGSAARQNTTGLSLFASGASVTLNFKGIENQTVSLNIPATSGSKPYSISLNGEVVTTGNPGSGSSVVNVVLKSTGDQTLVVTMTGSPSGTLAISSLSFGNFGYAGSQSGASGRTGQVYLLPTELTLTVGAGGVGQAGGQAVTSAQNGQRGSGGAAGGNGGDGVVIVYEFKNQPRYEVPPQPLFTNLNKTGEIAGIYRTDYIGGRFSGAEQQFVSYMHKLRERTKTVFAIMVGAGGPIGASGVPISYTAPTKLIFGASEYVASSGTAPYLNNGGAGGDFSPTEKALFSATGAGGVNSSQGSAAPDQSVIVGSYGRASSNTPGSVGGGGYGGYALIHLDNISENRTIELQVASTMGTYGFYYTNMPGAVFIFETESEYGPFISQLAELVLKRETIAGTNVTQVPELILKKEFLAATTVTQVPELILKRESDASNPLQVSHAAAVFVVDQTDPETAISQTPELILKREAPGGTQISQAVEQVFMRMGNLPYRISQLPQLLLLSEIPTIFWLNFGTLVNPVRFQLYTSLIGRATSVQPGAYIQLESPHAEGTTLIVNGVEVGLSSPVVNNDQVAIKGGVTNFWQKEMNVYTYYTKNGQIARELVGTWKIQQPDLTPTKGRAYGEYAKVSGWILLRQNYGMVTLQSVVGKSLSVIGRTLVAVYTSSRSALASLGQLVTSANAAVFRGPDSVVSKALATVFRGPDAMVNKANTQTAKGADSVIASAHVQAENSVISGWINAQVNDGKGKTEFDDGVSAGVGTIDMSSERSFAAQVEYENTDFIPTEVNYGKADDDFEIGGPVNYGKKDQKFELLEVGKVVGEYQEYTPMISTGFAQTFRMGFMDTIAYSVLTDQNYERGVGQGTGAWIVPLGYAELAKAKFGIVEMWPAEKGANHSEFVDRDTYKEGAHDFHNFSSSAFIQKIGISEFEMYANKRVESVQLSTPVTWVRAIAEMGVARLTPFIAAQSVNGRGAASLYMGFDTLQDVTDYTSQYAGVTTLQMYNGYVYNLAVDKTFVCEIYYNGPISGLIQGG